MEEQTERKRQVIEADKCPVNFFCEECLCCITPLEKAVDTCPVLSHYIQTGRNRI
jgi:hypothetical protein